MFPKSKAKYKIAGDDPVAMDDEGDRSRPASGGCCKQRRRRVQSLDGETLVPHTPRHSRCCCCRRSRRVGNATDSEMTPALPDVKEAKPTKCKKCLASTKHVWQDYGCKQGAMNMFICTVISIGLIFVVTRYFLNPRLQRNTPQPCTVIAMSYDPCIPRNGGTFQGATPCNVVYNPPAFTMNNVTCYRYCTASDGSPGWGPAPSGTCTSFACNVTDDSDDSGGDTVLPGLYYGVDPSDTTSAGATCIAANVSCWNERLVLQMNLNGVVYNGTQVMQVSSYPGWAYNISYECFYSIENPSDLRMTRIRPGDPFVYMVLLIVVTVLCCMLVLATNERNESSTF